MVVWSGIKKAGLGSSSKKCLSLSLSSEVLLRPISSEGTSGSGGGGGTCLEESFNGGSGKPR